MRRTFTAILVAGFAVAPAFAMEDMACADFTAMSPEEQADAVSTMAEGMAPDGGMMAEGGMMAQGDAGEGMAGAGMMAADGMAAEDMARRAAAACAEHPEMMLGEAMHE